MIDTLKMVQDLTASGMERSQAEALAKNISAGLKESAATKADLLQVKIELIMWMAGLLLAQAGLVLTVAKLMLAP